MMMGGSDAPRGCHTRGKTGIRIGKWAAGHIPQRLFPLRARPASFKSGQTWHWALIQFHALGLSFRVLLLLNSEREIYRAILGVGTEKDFTMICVHEFHAKEPGWHCHFVEEIKDAPQGWQRRGMRRFPKGAKMDAVFDVTENTAIWIAQRVFRIEERGSLL